MVYIAIDLHRYAARGDPGAARPAGSRTTRSTPRPWPTYYGPTCFGSLLAVQLPAGAEDPEKWGQYLDEWVTRHREQTDPDQGPRPVSGNLPEASLAEQVSMALAEVRALEERERVGSATDSQRESWYLRKAELFDRLAAAEPREPAYAEAAANARRQLGELP